MNFKTLDDIRKYQKEILIGGLGMNKNNLTDCDMLMSQPTQKVYCETCTGEIKLLNDNIKIIFTLILKNDTLTIKKYFINKITENVCNLEIEDILTCPCGKRDMTKKTKDVVDEFKNIFQEKEEDNRYEDYR